MKSNLPRLTFGVAVVVLGGAALFPFLWEIEPATSRAPQSVEDDHEKQEEGIIRLTEQQVKSLKLVTIEVRRGSLTQTLELPGEVQWNTDRLVHITPRVSGIVASVERTLGSVVAEGDVLCTLDSRDIGEAKMEYLSDLGRFAVAEAIYERARTVHENTGTLLQILAEEPDPDSVLTQVRDLPVGENKNRLLKSYTQFRVQERNLSRTRDLLEKRIASEADLLSARGAYEIARADYISTREEITFDLELSYLRAELDFRLAKTEVKNAERALLILGVSPQEIEALAQKPDAAHENISRSTLYAPLDGVVVDRHLTRGERVEPGTRLYTIADPRVVWVMGRVYERDLRHLGDGQKTTVGLDAFPGEQFEGVIEYIGSELDPSTRTVDARIALKNPKHRFRPGMFGRVTVFVEHAPGTHTTAFLVPQAVLQRTQDGFVVFRQHEPGEYEAVPVQVLEQSQEFAEITGELSTGDLVMAGDIFVLKSEAEKAHMGHGHQH